MAADGEITPSPRPITSFGAATSDGNVYIYGGHSGKMHNYSTATTIGNFYRLNVANPAKWEELPSGPILQGLASVARDNKFYRIGGMQPRNKPEEKSDLISIAGSAVFDVKTGKWQDLPDMPDARSSHDAVILNDKIYVAGGWKMNGNGKDSDWHKTALILDLKKAPLKWETIEQPFERRALTMAAYEGKVYVIGGFNSDDGAELAVDIFDPEKKTWSKGPDLPGKKMNGFAAAACVVDDRLFVSPADGKVYRLTAAGDFWEEVGALKQPRIVHRVVPFGKQKMLAVGGSSKGVATAEPELFAITK
jgi:N-acetylneuraminic acid mutarotase